MASGSPAVDTPGPSQEGTAPDKRHTSAHQRPGPRTQTRQQRAAMISDEVRTIARGTTEVKSNGAFRSIEGGGNPTKEVSPQAKGQNVTGGAMGDNAAPGREGPNAQGVQQVVSSDVEEVRDERRTQHDRKVGGQTHEPTEGGDSVLGASGQESPVSAEEAMVTGVRRDYAASETSSISAGKPSTPSRPARVNRNQMKPENYLHSGAGGATIAAANFEGVVEDRFRTLAEPAAEGTSRHPAVLAKKIVQGQLVRFASQKEKDAVLKIVRPGPDQRTMPNGEVSRRTPLNEYTTLPEAVRQSVVDKLVLGKYDPNGLLEGKTVHKQPALNEIAKMTLKNGTYLQSDGDRFLRKVQSLLPAMQASQPQRQQSRQQPGPKAAQPLPMQQKGGGQQRSQPAR